MPVDRLRVLRAVSLRRDDRGELVILLSAVVPGTISSATGAALHPLSMDQSPALQSDRRSKAWRPYVSSATQDDKEEIGRVGGREVDDSNRFTKRGRTVQVPPRPS